MNKPLPKVAIVSLAALYVLLVAAIVSGMFYWRHVTVSAGEVEQSQAEWNQWRTLAAKDDGKHSPVQRTIPKSEEPPMLVLLRDHFPACVIGLLAPLTGLYAFIAWLAIGVWRQSAAENGKRE
ncbi:MAG TPA: hypothetical protein VGJ15_10550 [Pirellulales bacterium]